jgi:tryptophan synthase beta chain
MKTYTIDSRYFGSYGGRYIPEVLRPAFEELEAAFAHYIADPAFNKELDALYTDYVGRPTPLYFAENLTRHLGGAKIYFKMEALAHTGAHKINNAVGQALLAKRMGKKRVIAETGAGQHGLASAAAAAKMGLECEIFMGEVDVARQHPNVLGMKLYGAKVTPVLEGTKTLTDAVNAAMKNWTERVADTHYIIGSALGADPYPRMVRTFQSIIGREVKRQMVEKEGRLPDALIACVGGGSNSMGLFYPFIGDSVKMIGVEAGGRSSKAGDHATRMNGGGKPGIVQGYRSYFLQDDNGSLQPTHSISAGLDYAGIGPELASLGDSGRIEFVSARDDAVLEAVRITARMEGILPALESSHALAETIVRAPKMPKESLLVVNISGRGDKDIFITAPYFDEDWKNFLAREAVRLGGTI